MSHPQSYPRQLISSLATQMNVPLQSFFEIENKKIFDGSDINDMIADTLWDYIKNETNKPELKSVYSVQARMRRQKKARWINAFTESLDYPITDRKNPFHFVQSKFDELAGHDFLKLYDCPDVEGVIENYKKRIDDWQNNEASLLIEYPLIFNKTKKQVVSSYRIDLILNLIDIIMDSLDGNIESYFSKKPDVLVDSPIFAANKFSIPMKETLDSYVANLFSSDSDNLELKVMVNYDPNHPESLERFRVFDPKDNQILMTLFNNITLDFYESQTVVMEIGAIAKALNNRPNKRLYEDVKKRLHNMGNVGFRFYKKDSPDESPVFTFNFFDNVITRERDDKEYAVVTFGKVLSESVTAQKMIAVTSSSYKSLELELSRLLYHKLQKERILLSASSVPDEEGYLFKSYDYSFFQRIVLFKKKKKSDNILLIKEALEEFVTKNIALAKYSYKQSQGLFYLHYFPLSEDEKADLKPRKDEYEDTIKLISDDSLVD